MIEPQLKRGLKHEGRDSYVVWRLYYLTGETWQVHTTWTCDTRAEARWFAFTHQWLRIGAAAAGVPEREVAQLLVESRSAS